MRDTAKFYRTIEKKNLFKIDPNDTNIRCWCRYQNGQWVVDKLSDNWFHKIIMSDYTDYEETTDPKVYEEWIKEADKRDNV